jgi:hypothetical protein
MAYVATYTLGIFLFMPGTLLPTLGAAVYRAYVMAFVAHRHG